MKVAKFILEIYRKFPGLLITTTVMLVLTNLLGACSLLTISPMVDLLLHPDMNNVSSLTRKTVEVLTGMGVDVTLTNLMMFFILFFTLSTLFQLASRFWILKTKYMVLRDLMLGTYDDFFNARWYFFSSGKQGELMNAFSREMTIVGDAFGAMGLFFANLLHCLFFISIPLFISWQVTLISVTLAVIFAVPFLMLGQRSYQLGIRNTQTANQLVSVIQEHLVLAKVILGFGNQDTGRKDLEHSFDAHRDVTIKSQMIGLIIPIAYRPFGLVMMAASLLAAKYFAVPLSEVAVLIMALFQVALSVGDLSMRKNSLDNFFPSYEQIMRLRERAGELKQTSGVKTFEGFKKEILVRDLSFAFPNHPPVLKNINLVIPKGKMVALVGKSGAGKSTLVDIIMGFYTPLQGKVLFDDTPLEEFDIRSYRKRIGYVPQESILFNTTITHNLLWANDTADSLAMRDACRLAYADDFIERFPSGYETLVGDRGVRLSGGQIQRVALARAFLRRPELLILDEATSSLDTQSEQLIQKAIENIAKETTVLVVAHRLSTIKKADCIYVVEDGQIVEKGSYQDLTLKKGYFNSMVKLQELGVTS